MQQQGMLGCDTFLALSLESSHTSATKQWCLSVDQRESLLKGKHVNVPLKHHGWTDKSGATDTRGRSCSQVSPNMGHSSLGVARLVWTAASACISFIISRISGRGLLGAIRSNWF